MTYLSELVELAQPFRQMRQLSNPQDIYALIFEDRDITEQERTHALAFVVEELEALAAHLRQVLDGVQVPDREPVDKSAGPLVWTSAGAGDETTPTGFHETRPPASRETANAGGAE